MVHEPVSRMGWTGKAHKAHKVQKARVRPAIARAPPKVLTQLRVMNPSTALHLLKNPNWTRVLASKQPVRC